MKLSRGERIFLALWAMGVLLLYVAGGIDAWQRLRSYVLETEEFRSAWMASPTTDLRPLPSGTTTSDVSEVVVGTYLQRITGISLSEREWVGEFDLWFSWSGDDLRPAETFHLVDGEIEEKELRIATTLDGRHYERYGITARIPIRFDPLRTPFGDQVLLVQIEDETQTADQLRYIADVDGSGCRPGPLPEGLQATTVYAGAKLHDYAPGAAEATMAPSIHPVYSRFVFAMIVKPKGVAFYLKLFQALFVSMALGLIAFFIKPIHVDPRFGLGIGAVFAAVGNNIFVSTVLPHADRLTLADMVNTLGLVTILFTLIGSTISLYIWDTMGREELSRIFDRICFTVFLIGSVVLTIALPLAAMP